MSEPRICRYCGKLDDGFICMNSRDATDMAVSGNERCFAAIEKQGWGEAGERYIRLNKHAVDSKHQWKTGSDFPYCVLCGVVRRADGSEKPCRGLVKIGLRDGG